MKLPENIDSKFRFITITAMRAKQLQRGARVRVETASTKPTSIARQEVLDGLIDFQVGDDATSPMEESEVTEFLEG